MSLEAEFHKRIKHLLTKRDQGRVMGAFREAMDMIPKDTDSHYRLTLEFGFQCPESDEHYWKAVIAFLAQKHLNMELTIPRCKLETYRTSPVYKLVTAASEQWDMKPLNPRPHVDTVDGCPNKPAAAPDADLSLKSFIQDVPSHCDRILWRGRYIHLKED